MTTAIAYTDWENLDRETQIHMAEYDDGEFRVLSTFTTIESRRREDGMWKLAAVTWSACEELLNGRWEGFVSTKSVEWL